MRGTAKGAGGERRTAQGAGWGEAGQRKASVVEGNSARRRMGESSQPCSIESTKHGVKLYIRKAAASSRARSTVPKRNA
eukprot:2480654-Pleurochrysis_carterae.AAC.1